MNWQIIGYIGVSLFVLAIIAILIARRLFLSSSEKTVELGETVLGSLGGAKRYREASEEKERRFMRR
jgi:hypothetical protein